MSHHTGDLKNCWIYTHA